MAMSVCLSVRSFVRLPPPSLICFLAVKNSRHKMLRRGLTHGVHKRATLVIILHAIDRYFCGIIYTRSIVSPIYNIENSMEACSPVPQRRTAGDQWRIGGGCDRTLLGVNLNF